MIRLNSLDFKGSKAFYFLPKTSIDNILLIHFNYLKINFLTWCEGLKELLVKTCLFLP